ncbi:hypothetical protein, partial [Aquimarina sediminis]|uniref:hypothetical protein n=1 Tax=Aquimarina sediminis TaxID=2070536 RepID=UPI0013E8AB89
MKILYKLLIMGMVYLLSNNTYAQIQQYSDDGTESCIDCEEKNSGTERNCLCFGPIQFGIFENQISNVDYARERWLYEQELLLAGAITGINYFAMYHGPVGVPANYNFEQIQRAYFKEKQTNALAQQYFDKADAIIKSSQGYNNQTLQSATINAKILDIRKREGTANTNYGDLKYNGKLLKQMTDAEVNNLLNEQLGIRNNQRSAAREYGIRNSRLQRMLNEGYISNTLAGHLVVHYKSLDYENAIRFMTRYMAWINSGDPQVPYEIFGNPHNIFTLEDNETQYLTNLVARTGGTSPPMDGYTHPLFIEMADDVALFDYAINSFGDSATSFLKRSANQAIKNEAKKYLGYHKYNTDVLKLSKDVFTSYATNSPFPHNQYTYSQDTGIISSVGYQDAQHPNRLFGVGNISADQLHRLYGLGNMLSSLSELSDVNKGFIGQFFIEILKAHGHNISSVFNAEQAFDLFHFTDFGYSHLVRQEIRADFNHNIGQTLWNSGLNFLGTLNDPFKVEAVLAIANSGEVDFYDEVILDSSFLNTNAYCVYSELKKRNGNLFRTTIGSFIDDPKYKLYFRVGQCTNTDQACTDGNNISTTNIVTIKLENTLIKSLDAASLLLHEGVHAELYRFVDQAHNGEVNPNDRKQLFDLYKNYKGLNSMSTRAQHNYMTEKYVIPIAKAIRELDNNKYPLNHYMGFGWDGLRDYDYQ